MPVLARRKFIQGSTCLAIAGCSKSPSTATKETSVNQAASLEYSENAWRKADKIVSDTIIPSFPDQIVSITDFGASPDGQVDASASIQKAIQACAAAGGGKVEVPPGQYLCGPIHLESNINFHISEGATLLFDTNPKRYLPEVFTRWEGVEFMGYSPLIYAYGKQNIAVTGAGTLDGQANRTTWWAWKGNEEWGVEGYPSQANARTQLFNDAENGVPPEQRHYSEGAFLRPPFVQPYKCKNVLIENIRIINAPFWLLNPTLCENVTIRGVHLESLGPNSDGCDPESCRNVVIEDCYFDTGDDCIAIKSGRNNDGRRVATPTENVVIRNCKMRAGHGGIVVGSEISGGVNHVFAENNEMSSPDLERGIRIKTNSVRGGLIEDLYFRNNSIGKVKDAIVINFFYEEGDAGQFDPIVQNILIESLNCQSAQRVFHIRGFPRAPIKNFTLSQCDFVEAGTPGIIENVEGLNLNQVSINGKPFAVEPA